MKIQTEEIEKYSENVNKISRRKFESDRNNTKRTAPASRKDNNYKSQQKTCYRCGGEFPHANKCPALGKTCSSCGKTDHFSRVCRSTPQQKMGRNQREGSYSRPLNTLEESGETPLNVVVH